MTDDPDAPGPRLISTFMLLQHHAPVTGEVVNIAVVVRPSKGSERVYYDPTFARTQAITSASVEDLERAIDLFTRGGVRLTKETRVISGGVIQNADDDAEVGAVLDRYIGISGRGFVENEAWADLILGLHEKGIENIAAMRKISIDEAREIHAKLGDEAMEPPEVKLTHLDFSGFCFDDDYDDPTDDTDPEPDLATMDTVEDVVVPTLSPAPPVDDEENDVLGLW